MLQRLRKFLDTYLALITHLIRKRQHHRAYRDLQQEWWVSFYLILVLSLNPGAKSRDKSAFYLVFKFCDFDLAGLLSHPSVKLAIDDIKGMMKHLLNGLFHIHTANILHRDMKTANILVSIEGVLKLADFGLSRNMPSKCPGYNNNLSRVFRIKQANQLYKPSGHLVVSSSRTVAWKSSIWWVEETAIYNRF